MSTEAPGEQTECGLISMTNCMTGVCEANGINIHYLRTGGSKPPIGSASRFDRLRSLLDTFGTRSRK